MAQADPGRHHRATTQTMERVTVRVDEDDLDSVEQLVESGKFPNRSEVIREAIRELLAE